MSLIRSVVKMFSGYFGIFVVILLALAQTDNSLASNHEDADENILSPRVCSPGTSPRCTAGPHAVPVPVPEGAVQASIEVFWEWEGQPGQVQPNEHSWFHLIIGGATVESIYCQDFGDDVPDLQHCGSTVANVEGLNTISLAIEHADEQQGPTPGSHHQRWFITWLTEEEPTPPPPFPPEETPTPTPTPDETPVEPTPPTPPVDPTPTPDETPVDPTPTEIPVDPTPTETPVDTPVAEPPFTPTPEPPDPTPTPTPQPILPVTGADAGGGGSNTNILVNSLFLLVGMALIFLGIRKKMANL